MGSKELKGKQDPSNTWANKTSTTDAKPKQPAEVPPEHSKHTNTHITHPPDDLISLQNHNNVTLFYSLLFSINLHLFLNQTSCFLAPAAERCRPTCERMLVHCCSRETGGFPRLVASWTLSSCSFCVRLSCRA